MRMLLDRLAAALICLAAAMPLPARAQEAPALSGISEAEKARIQALIKGATAEGQVSYWDAVFQPETNDALTAGFRKRYGLPAAFKVGYTLASTANLVTRIDQELAAGRVTIDIGGVASLPWVFERIRDGKIMGYDSPAYADYGKALAQGLGRKGYTIFNGAYAFLPMWNADTLKFAGTSYKDVIGSVPAQRISIGDATKSETYLATYIGQRTVLGRDFFEALAKMQPNFLVRSEQIAARLVSDEDQMAFSAMALRAYQNNQRGATLKFIQPKEGVVLMAQASFILKDAPHPNAAKLWTDYILSEEGQKIIVEKEGLISGRDGFKSPIPDYAPAIEALNIIPVDWSAVTTEEMRKARAEWAGIFGR